MSRVGADNRERYRPSYNNQSKFDIRWASLYGFMGNAKPVESANFMIRLIIKAIMRPNYI